MPFDTSDQHADDSTAVGDPTAGEESRVAGAPVVVRRHAGIATVVGAAASAVAIAYLWRASQTLAVLDWALFGVMALIAAYYLASLVDARTPLLVADDLGVRIRLGHDWRGLPWEAIGQVVVHPRRGPLRDGRLVFLPRSLARALEGLDAKALRHVAMNQKLYGAALAVPVGTTTRVSTTGERSVVEELSALTLGRAEVVELEPPTHGAPEAESSGRVEPEDAPAAADPVGVPGLATSTGPAPDTSATAAQTVHVDAAATSKVDPEPGPLEDGPPRSPRRSILGGIGTIVSRVAKGRVHDVDAAPAAAVDDEERGADAASDAEFDEGGPVLPPRPLAPTALRETRPGLRAEATLDLPTAGSSALDPAHADAGSAAGAVEGRELRRPGSVDLVFERVDLDDRVRPISTLGDPVEPLVIDDYVTEPAYDPVIGPELTAARTRLGLSVDNIAERTRIRPHVIESIEVDDFAPCGGDFYARGHLRTLARILGKDPEPLLETFEKRYATAPVNARRVFEAELATGMTGSMRSTVGGPNWGLLVGVVLGLVLVWGVVRIFTTEPVDMVEMPAPVLDGAAGLQEAPVAPGPAAAGKAVAEPVSVRLTASQADSRVVVRDGEGRVVFTGELVIGERKTLQVAPPVRIRAADGGAVEVRVAGRDKGLLGEAGEPARRTFR